MDLDLLTVLIAVGGMATGVGAIWAAWVARRQLRAHAEFVEEQSVLMRRQTELTAQSVAAQLKSLQLRDERERIRLEVTVMSQLWEEWTGPVFQRYRRASFQYFLDHYLVDGQMRGVWKHEQKGSRLTVTIEPFEELPAWARAGRGR